MAKIYNISAGSSFVDTLAELFVKEYQDKILSLVDVIFLMPNKRACRALKDAFLRVRGLQPLMLPKIVSIGDVEEDEILISGFDLAKELKNISPAISKTERILLFTKIIMAKPQEFGLENMNARQACFLANELASLIDMADYEGLSFNGLKNLVPEEYATHWQETLKFLEIITHYWPQILQERGLVDPAKRYNQLLMAQSAIWQTSKTMQRIVVAGGMANFPAIQKLIKTVLSLPNGEFYINGLDKFLDDESWEMLDETHPECEIKKLLDDLKIDRFAVKDIAVAENIDREKLVSEVMRPAKTTDKWRDIKEKNISHIAWRGLEVIECENSREEALAIALIMREALETPEKTAALVTPDRNLARRVAVELERWNIKVDDSAGKPLSLTPPAIFMRLIIKACSMNFTPVEFLGLLKHPLLFAGANSAEVRKAVRDYEYNVLRSSRDDRKCENSEFIDTIRLHLKSLQEVLNTEKSNLKNLIKTHIETAVMLASTFEEDGNKILWKGEDGETLARFFADLYEKSDILGEIDKGEYLGLIEALMASSSVRAVYGTHPRLKILGPIEARLNSFDMVIIGGVNESIWPKATAADPWMSRPMKRDFGFPLPEKNIGVLAKDFASLLAANEVYITRADRVEGTPMIKSRWLMRLETVISALGIKLDEIENNVYSQWAKKLDEVEQYKRILPPEPKPPVSARPRKLSASAIDALIRDPYIVFAKYILRLKPLEDLNPDLTAADYGNIIHGVLDKFNKLYPQDFPNNAKEELLKIGTEVFKHNEIALETRAFWWPKFEKIVDWIVKQENAYRGDIKQIHSEIEGSLEFDAPAGKFIITAKADRVDETKDGKINIIDYKTGQARSKKEIQTGYAPQLPIEGLIARYGGFNNILAQEVAGLIYWKLADKEIAVDDKVDDVLEQNFKNIQELIALFDFDTTAYIAKPNPKYVTANKDYEHLARVKEWSVEGGFDD